jgi:hypothetical protein
MSSSLTPCLRALAAMTRSTPTHDKLPCHRVLSSRHASVLDGDRPSRWGSANGNPSTRDRNPHARRANTIDHEQALASLGWTPPTWHPC